jgi:hypothetical protein
MKMINGATFITRRSARSKSIRHSGHFGMVHDPDSEPMHAIAPFSIAQPNPEAKFREADAAA